MPTRSFSPRAASDAGACVRRFYLYRIDQSPDWDSDRRRSSVHEVVAGLVRSVERSARGVSPTADDAEAIEAGLIEGARRELRQLCDVQHAPDTGERRLLEDVDASAYSRASARLLRGAVGVLTNMHARWLRLGRVELLEPSELQPVDVGHDVLVKPDVHLLYRRPDGRVVAVLWRTGRPHVEHQHHAALVELALAARFPAVGVACVNVYTWDAHEALLSEEDRDAAPAYWADLAAAVRRALDAHEAPLPLPMGSKPCEGCRMARPCGRLA